MQSLGAALKVRVDLKGTTNYKRKNNRIDDKKNKHIIM